MACRGGVRRWLAAVMVTAGAAPVVAQSAGDDAAYRAGIGLLGKGLPDLAAAELEKYLKEHPAGAEADNARYALAVCLARAGKHAEAAPYLDRVLAVKGFEFGADAALLRARCAIAAGDDAGAARVLGVLLEEHPGFARADQATALRGEALYRAGDPKAARACLDGFAKAWPASDVRDRAELFCALAECADGEHRAGAARAAALRARSPKGPYASNAALTEARARQAMGEWKQSGACYDAVLTEGPDELKAEALLGRAQVARASGDLAGAESALARLAGEAPVPALAGPASLERGRVLFDRAKYADAARAFESAAKAGPESLADDAAYWSAMCALRDGRPGVAARMLQDSAARYGSSELLPDMLLDRAAALAAAGDDAGAESAYAAWAARFASHPLAGEAAIGRASCLHRLGKYEESLAVCRGATAAPGRVAGAFLLLSAENLYALGRFADARDAYADFGAEYAADPNAWRATVRAGLCLLKLDRADEAKRVLEVALREPGASSDSALRRAAVSALAQDRYGAKDWAGAERWYTLLAKDSAGGPGEADALLRLGLCVQRQGRGADAEAIFERAERASPDPATTVRVAFERGQVLADLGRLDDARAKFEQVTARDGGDDALRALALRHLAAIASRQGRAADAATLLGQLPAGAGGEDAMMEQAGAWMGAGKPDEAARVYRRIAEGGGPRSAEARARAAAALNRMGEYGEALKELEVVTGSGSSQDAATRGAAGYERALALRGLGRDDEAEKEYRSILGTTTTPEYEAFSALDLAQILSRGEQFKEALALLDRCHAAAEALNEADRATLGEREMYLRGLCLLRLDRATEACAALAPFRDAFPASELSARVGLALGEALVRAGRPSEGVAELKRTAEAQPPPDVAPLVVLKLGDACAAAQQWASGEAAYTTFLDRFGQHELWFQARFGQGWCREQQGRHDAASEAYRDVVARHTGATAARAQFQIGECLYAQKKLTEAVAELLKVDVLYAYPEWSAAALFEAGRCLADLNRPAEAVRQFEDVAARFPESTWAAMARERAAAVRPAPVPGREARRAGGAG